MRDIMLITHFVGLALAIGVSLSNLVFSNLSSKLGDSKALELLQKTKVINKYGHIGLTLLFLSGGYLMTPMWSSLSSMPLLITKFILFGVIILSFIVIGKVSRRLNSGETKKSIAKLKRLNAINFILYISTLACAVFVFH